MKPPKRVDQIPLVSAILHELSRQGVKLVDARLMNAAIQAADLVVAEARRERVYASPAMGLDAWLKSDDVGESSRYMVSVMFGRPAVVKIALPRDPDDFGRCVRLLDAVPGTREKLSHMKKCGPEWDALVENWERLEVLYREELPSGHAPKLYEEMRKLGC